MDATKLGKIISRTLMWLGITIGSLFVILLILVGWYAYPPHCTDLIETVANKYLNAEVKIGSVELNISKDFPFVYLSVDSVEIVSHAFNKLNEDEKKLLPQNGDTLLVADRITGGINLADIAKGNINLKGLRAESAKVNFVIYSPELTNADIFPPSDEEPSEMPKICFDKLEISKDSRVRFFSLVDGIDTEVDINSVKILDNKENSYQLQFEGLASFDKAEMLKFSKVPVKIDTKLGLDLANLLKFDVNGCNLKFGEIPASFNLNADFTNDIKINKFNLVLGEFNLNDLCKYVPAKYLTVLDGIKTNCHGTVKVRLTEPYSLSNKLLPSGIITVHIPDSYLHDSATGRRLESFRLLAEAMFKGDNVDASTVNVKDLTLRGRSIFFSAKGKMTNPISNPHLAGDLECNVDIARAINVFKLPMGNSTLNGKATADMKFNVNVNDIKAKNYDKINVSGNLVLSNLAMVSPDDDFDLSVDKANFFFGSKEKMAERDSSGVGNIFKASFSVDSLNVNYAGANLKVLASKIALGGKGNIHNFGKMGHFIPVGARITGKEIKFMDVDSSLLRFVDLDCRSTVVQSEEHNSFPLFEFNIKAKKARFRNDMVRTGFRDGDICLNLKPRVNDYTLKIDSLYKLHPGMNYDSIVAMAESDNLIKGYADTNDSTVNRVRGILQRWNVSGHVKAKKTNLITPYFPLRNRIKDLDMNFSMDSLVINSGKYLVGRSSFDLSGGIRNLRSTIMGNKETPLKMDLVVYSDTLDVNEILAAMYTGSKYSRKDAENILDSELDDKALEHELNSQVENSDTLFAAIVIPENVEADIDVFAKYGRYVDLKLQDMSGGLQLRNGSLLLNEVRTNSDVGNLRFNALYSAPKKEDINCAFDLSLEGIQLDKFIKLIPSVDSIMPLLNNMDGIIKADIAATAKLDTSMNIVLPSMVAVMKLQGDSLVLFDSEMFSKISKMLRFKNKKRNLIDRMAVEIAIKDNVMELFPFMFKMDRYKLGIMGSNDLNLNFKYHISVLKSPIPFKFGVNLSGNPDKWKLRFGGAKYKEGRVAKVSTIVEDTRINLREQMHKAFKRGAKAAIKTNLDERMRKNKLDAGSDTLSAQDSIKLIKEGLIEAPLTPKEKAAKAKADKKKKNKNNKNKSEAVENKQTAVKQD